MRARPGYYIIYIIICYINNVSYGPVLREIAMEPYVTLRMMPFFANRAGEFPHRRAGKIARRQKFPSKINLL